MVILTTDLIADGTLAALTLDPGVVLGAGLAIMSIIISIVIWYVSTRAVKRGEAEETPAAYIRQVDEEAYERARKIYEAAIDQLEDELSRVNNMARELQLEVFRLNSELVRIRRKTDTADDTPA